MHADYADTQLAQLAAAIAEPAENPLPGLNGSTPPDRTPNGLTVAALKSIGPVGTPAIVSSIRLRKRFNQTSG